MTSDSNPYASPAEMSERTPGHGHPFRSGHSLASTAIVCLAVVMVIRICLASACALLAAEPPHVLIISQAVHVGGILNQLATLLSGAAFIVWFYLAYSNLRALSMCCLS